MSKKHVGVIFGGRSVEHEVSIVTAQQVIENMSRDKYEIIPIYISQSGNWYSCDKLIGIENFKDINRLINNLDKVFLQPSSNGNHLLYLPQRRGLFSRPKEIRLDVLFPALHGTYGEDGCIQGLLNMIGLPYVGAGVLGSAVGMDKIVSKSILEQAGMPVVDYTWLTHQQWQDEADLVIRRIDASLSYPVIIKPANLGSSIGISQAADIDSLKFGIDIAGHYSRRIIVEQGLTDFMEINCSVMGNEDELQVSLCEQPISWKEFLTYEEKYLNTGKGGGQGMAGAQRRLPAPISDEATKKIQQFAIQTFRLLDCAGIALIDFLYDNAGKNIYINEINTMPGSIAYYLWEPLGINFS